MPRITIPVQLLTLLSAACQGARDTTPPTTVSSIPADGAAGVATGIPLSITYSEAMNAPSVQVNPVPALELGQAAWQGTATVVYSPPGGWQPGTSYTVDVQGNDLAGNALAGGTRIAFRTAALADETPPAAPTNVRATALSPWNGTWAPKPTWRVIRCTGARTRRRSRAPCSSRYPARARR